MADEDRTQSAPQAGQGRGGGRGTATQEQDRPVTAEDAKRIEEAHKVKPVTMDDVKRVGGSEAGVPEAAGTGHGPIARRHGGKVRSERGKDTESNA